MTKMGASLLDDLEPETEYADFIKLWDDIQHARDRKIKLRQIYEKLKSEQIITVTYSTFTRYVKRKEQEESTEPRRPPARPTLPQPGAISPEPVFRSTDDKASEVATEAAMTLKTVKTQTSAKDYSKAAKGDPHKK